MTALDYDTGRFWEQFGGYDEAQAKVAAIKATVPKYTPYHLLLWMALNERKSFAEITGDDLGEIRRLRGVGKTAIAAIRDARGEPKKLTPLAALRLIAEMGDATSRKIAARALADAGHQLGNPAKTNPGALD